MPGCSFCPEVREISSGLFLCAFPPKSGVPFRSPASAFAQRSIDGVAVMQPQLRHLAGTCHSFFHSPDFLSQAWRAYFDSPLGVAFFQIFICSDFLNFFCDIVSLSLPIYRNTD